MTLKIMQQAWVVFYLLVFDFSLLSDPYFIFYFIHWYQLFQLKISFFMHDLSWNLSLHSGNKRFLKVNKMEREIIISSASKTIKEDTDAEIWRIIYQMKSFSTDGIDRLWGFGFFLVFICFLHLENQTGAPRKQLNITDY